MCFDFIRVKPPCLGKKFQFHADIRVDHGARLLGGKWLVRIFRGSRQSLRNWRGVWAKRWLGIVLCHLVSEARPQHDWSDVLRDVFAALACRLRSQAAMSNHAACRQCLTQTKLPDMFFSCAFRPRLPRTPQARELGSSLCAVNTSHPTPFPE